MAGDSIEGFASYVPVRVARQLAANQSPPDGPRTDRFFGAVLLADISGFTALTESLARRGEVGAEAAGTTVGRLAEQQAIEKVLGALAERGEGAAIVFEGMAGIGKSRLVEEVKRRARRSGLACLESGGDAMEKSTAYYPWRGIFDQALGLDPGAGADERQTRVAARLAERGRPEWTERLPLLNPVLRTTFQPTEATSSMNERARASATHELLADLLAALSHEGSHEVVVLEDAQWMDSASLALASCICLRRDPVVMVFATRPIPGPAFEAIEALSRAPGARRFNLAPLGADEAIEIACRGLGVARVPDAVEGVIRSKAGGNPLLSQELAYALRDAGLIQVADGECRLAPDAGDLRSVDLPGSIHAAVTARMDRLSPSQRLLLKVVSVVGRVFEADVVLRLHPGNVGEASILEDLRALETMRITARERSDPTPAYAFGHLAFQEVNYRLMLFSQRRQLHRAMAELLEERHAAALSTVYPLLALHWGKAVEEGDAEPALVWKAIDYLQKAGEQALQQFANHEAVDFLTGALRLLEKLPESVERSRRELGLCCTIGAPLLVTKGFAAPETERAYSRASQLCQELENSPEQFGAVYGLWTFSLMKTQLSRARGLAAEVFRVAQAAGDPELLLPAHRAVGDTAFWLGDLTEARSQQGQADEGIAEMRRGIDEWRATGAELAGPYYLGLLAEAHGAAGRPDRAIEAILDAQASSTRSGEAWWRAELWRIDGELRLKLPTPDEGAAERRFLDTLDLARAQRARSLELRAAASLCRLWTKQGKPPLEAQRPLADALTWFTEGRETADLKQALLLVGR
jgi:predicted ATPase